MCTVSEFGSSERQIAQPLSGMLFNATQLRNNGVSRNRSLHSTVTLFARFRGLSIARSFAFAT